MKNKAWFKPISINENAIKTKYDLNACLPYFLVAILAIFFLAKLQTATFTNI